MVGGELTECLCDWRNNSIKREETEDIGETIAGMMSSGKWSKEKIERLFFHKLRDTSIYSNRKGRQNMWIQMLVGRER